MQRYVILFFIFLACYSVVDTMTSFPQIWRPSNYKNFLYDILITFLKKCDLNIRKVIIWDDFYYLETFLAMADIQPEISVTIIRNPGPWRKSSQFRFDDHEIDAVILIIDMEDDPWPELLRFFLRWRFKRNSIVYIFPKQMDFCLSYKQTLLYMMRFYFVASYYICVKYNKYPLIYTQDPYGDTKPEHWMRVNQNIVYGKVWTHYGRAYNKDLTEFCPGFNFTRTDPINQNISVGIPFTQINLVYRRSKDSQYGEEIEDRFIPSINNRVQVYKKLLKLKFNYVSLEMKDTFTYLQRAYDFTSIDTFLFNKYVLNMLTWWNVFSPIEYEPYGIISHSRGLMTPLEKIAKFYGVWTLTSLTIIVFVAFIVMWFITKKTHLASFNVIRLLINTAIIVPITNPARKLFFSMIFLYFLVIHATFSGHLAEFLTSVNHRSNIETLDDLRDPSVTKIYTFGYLYDTDQMILRKKSISLDESFGCHEITKNRAHVCIAPLTTLEYARLLIDHTNQTLYISKKTLGNAMISYLYRPGFPLAEKLNWATMFIFDTNVVHEEVRVNRRSLATLDNKHRALMNLNYRSITVNDIYWAFALLMIGNCAGILCFLFEVSYKRIRNRNGRQRHQRNWNISNSVRCCGRLVGERQLEGRFENIYDKIKNRYHRNKK